MKKNNFKKGYLFAAATMVSFSANAALQGDATLNFNPSVMGGYYGNEIVAGSYFGMDTNGDGNVSKNERSGFSEFNGVILGSSQIATGSHMGQPDGSESPNIDQPWSFFGNTGMHLTSSPTIVLSATGNVATVDFSGWAVTWNGISSIPMGSGAWGTNASGVANVTCAVDCAQGDTYVLDYTAAVPQDDPSGFGGVGYTVHLEGVISAGTIITHAVDIQVTDGNRQECSSNGGSQVEATADVLTNDVNDISSIVWFLDGVNIGNGYVIDTFVPLGGHRLSVDVNTVDSGIVRNNTSVVVADNTGPELAIRFIDQKSGQEITEVASRGKYNITVLHDAVDACDSTPVTNGVVSSVNLAGDGQTIAIIRGVLATSAVNATASAIDASGNASHANAQLLIID